MKNINDENMDLKHAQKFESKSTNKNQFDFISQAFLANYPWKNQSSQHFESLAKNSTDTSTYSSILDDLNNTDHDLECLKQDVYLYVDLLKHFINKFDKSINQIRRKNIRTRSSLNKHLFYRYKKNSTFLIDIFMLIKIFKKFKNSSRFLIESYDNDNLLLSLQKLLKQSIKDTKCTESKHESTNNKYRASPVGPAILQRQYSVSSLSSSSLNESFVDKKFTKNKRSVTKIKPTQIVENNCNYSNCYLNYESIFTNDIKSYKHSTPNNELYSNDISSSFYENAKNQDKLNSKISNLEKSYSEVSERDFLNKKMLSKKRKSRQNPKNSRYKIMTRNEYEALKVQLNVFRDDYRMEFYEKMHMKDFYEKKLKQVEFLNTKLKKELEIFKLNEMNDPFESPPINIL